MSKKPTMQSDMVVRKNKKPFIVVGSIVTILVVVTIGFFVLKSMEVVTTPALRVGEVEVSQTDFDEYVRLGEKEGMSKDKVRELVVEYEKNRQMAEQFSIDIPDAYIEYAKNEYNSTDVGIGARKEGDKREDRLTLARDYNNIFANRVVQATQAGYGVFVYEFSIPGGLSESTFDARSEQSKAVANKYRKKVADGKETPAAVLEEVLRYNAQNGQTVHSGFYFIPDIEYAGVGESDRYVKSPPYLLSILSDKSTSPMDVRMTDNNSYFFMYKAFEQKAHEGEVAEDIANAKESMRVVVYDR